MKLLPYIFLVAINAYQLTWQNADSLLKNGIRGNQCGNPNIGSRKRRSTATRSRNRPEILGRNKRNRPLEDWSHGHEMVLAMNQGKFKSCTPTSFTIEKNEALPEITLGGFYMPRYGAGKAGPQAFDPNKSYMGLIIMAVHSKGKWYTDHSKTFLNFNPVEKRWYTARIKPGYILMQESEYLEKNYPKRKLTKMYKTNSMHHKLLMDFTGKDLGTLKQEGVFYFGWGFSYQKVDSNSDKLMCDYKDKSTTFNGFNVTIPNIGTIPVIMNPNNPNDKEKYRDTGVKNLIKLVVNHWRITRKRVTKISDIKEYMDKNGEVSRQLPECPKQ